MSSLLAIGWEPELRGILIVIISVTVLCGSIFLILSTNMGVRLGFLVALAALFGWMFIMGANWWMYGKGLLGADPSWRPAPGVAVIQSPDAMAGTGLIPAAPDTAGKTPAQIADGIADQLVASGWKSLDASLPAYQQAKSSADVMLEQNGVFKAGQSQVVRVFDKGGQAYPKVGDFDLLAFFHKPYWAVVEVAPLVPQRAEDGRAPASPVLDTTRGHQYVYMLRDLGNKRQPAGIITISSLIAFLGLCWLLHRRDQIVTANRSAKALPAKA